MNMSLSPAEAKASSLLLGLYIANSSIGAAGILANIALITITIRNRRLHSTCSLLIGFSSFCSVLLQLFIFTPTLIVLLPQVDSVPLLTCFFVQVVPIYGIFNVISLMGAIGVDRLLSVFFPLWYIHRNERLCLFALIAFASAFPLLILWTVFQNAIKEPERPALCTLAELLAEETSLVAGFCLLINLLSVLCYTTVWAKLKLDIRRSLSQETVKSRQPIFKSLAIILGIQVGGWLISELAFGFLYLQNMNSIQMWHMAAAVNCFVCATAASDPIVLFATSEEYRKAFVEQFPFLLCLLPKIGNSHPQLASNQIGTRLVGQKQAWRSGGGGTSTRGGAKNSAVSSTAQNAAN